MSFSVANALPPHCRVLLVEDESLVAMAVEDTLTAIGCEVRLAMRLDAALRLAKTAAVDVAVLDVNLGQERSYPVADALSHRNIPFLFVSGYGRRGLDAAYQDRPTLQKPYRADELARSIGELLVEKSASGLAVASRSGE